jgi:CDP-2,3-bis-(O-geranylgeranyl)-sn-glycerol synthase
MAAELLNSFAKRQLGVAPGMAPRNRGLAAAFFIVDRVDSVLGVLLVLTLMAPVPPRTWFWVLSFGPGVHWLFSAWMYRLKVKARAL